MIKKLVYLFIILSFNILATNTKIPMIPLVPTTNSEMPEIKRTLLKLGSVQVPIEAKVIVPLEVISDIDIKALVFDNENIEIPFEIELSRKPEKDIYKINFTSTEIDIDNDGKVDTEIFINKRIGSKTITDNHVKITGKNITKEGTHKKRVYITVEVNE